MSMVRCGMLHRVSFLFTPLLACIALGVLVVVLGIGEMFTDKYDEATTAFIAMEDDRTIIPLRDFNMPNYWVWYHADDVTTSLRSHGRVDTYPLILLTLYNACVSTWVVAVCLVILTMFVVVRTCSSRSACNWAWVLPIAALVADLAEDICLLVILINFPVADFPALRHILAWSSFVKFALWGCTLLVLLRLGVFLLLYGGPAETSKEKGKNV